MEDKRKIGLIVTGVTTFMCGLPSLCAILFGSVFVIAGEDAVVNGAPGGLEVGLVIVCIGFLFALIPLMAAIYTFTIWQKEKNADQYATPKREEVVEVEVVETEAGEVEAVEEPETDEKSDEDEIPPAI